MRRQIVALTGTGQSAWIPVNTKQTPFNIGIGCVVSGTITYTIQHTFDDIFDASVTPTAFDHSTLAGETTNQDGNYAFPVAAIRINNTSGTGTTTMTLLQGI